MMGGKLTHNGVRRPVRHLGLTHKVAYLAFSFFSYKNHGV